MSDPSKIEAGPGEMMGNAGPGMLAGLRVIEVADEFCPWNAGRWRIAQDGTEKTAAEPDLACGIASLGCVYLGGFTFAQLARALRMRELRPGAIARADAMFRSDRAPWCPELF